MTQDTNVEKLIINKLTRAQYNSIANPDPAQLYFITDEVISSADVISALGYTPYNATNPNNYITASALTGYATETWVDTGLATKQETLVSGTNIKTINNNSILGSGNLTLDGLPSQTGQSGKFLTTDGTNASWQTVTIPTPTYDSVNERITW